MPRQCFDCGATPAEAAFSGAHKPTNHVDRCIECASGVEVQRAERIAVRRAGLAAARALAARRMRARKGLVLAGAVRQVERVEQGPGDGRAVSPPQPKRARRLRAPKAIITRASYRAALRRRAVQAQLDLVDLLVAAP